MKFKFILKNALVLCLLVQTAFVFGQVKDPSPFDYGRMWTFENPPKDWLKEAYDFEPEDEWFDFVRKSSLRFASWCSASFVSPDGLIMTNHHCSRDEGIKAQQGTENFDNNGFYANALSDERKIEGLYVEQMIMAKDITDEVMKSSVEEVEAKYAEMKGWEGLRLQVVGFYSGIKYSIYGYKRFDDIRLVCMPENSIGFYGGDPDNFTYPRYNLDFTFWRAYGEDGKPLDTSDNYLKFNKDGAVEGEAVFVVGNPGRTERYRSAAQLDYDRNHRYNQTLDFMTNRINMMREEYNMIKDDPNKVPQSQELLGTITSLANGQKAYTGILKGLNDPNLYGRKVAMEELVKSKSADQSPWTNLEKEYEKLTPHAWAINNLGQSGLRGSALTVLHQVDEIEAMIADKMDKDVIETAVTDMSKFAQGLDSAKEKKMLTMLIGELANAIPSNNSVLSKLMAGKSPADYVDNLMSNTAFTDVDALSKLMSKSKKLAKSEDPMLQLSRALIPAYKEAVNAFRSSGAKRQEYETQIVNKIFDVYGDALPPDATFTLRISDGVVKNYEYNGTVAPYKTTFFGMYDRHFSHGEEYPWNLPEKWLNPSMELLKSPVNIVSTNDIIGGNSGSPMINKNREAVGLIFDGNIESLPGNFIFDEESNRTVSVHAGGIHAALKYVYKADRLVKELEGK